MPIPSVVRVRQEPPLAQPLQRAATRLSLASPLRVVVVLGTTTPLARLAAVLAQVARLMAARGQLEPFQDKTMELAAALADGMDPRVWLAVRGRPALEPLALVALAVEQRHPKAATAELPRIVVLRLAALLAAAALAAVLQVVAFKLAAQVRLERLF